MKRAALLAAVTLGSAAPALATAGQATLADGHGYVSACSGSTLGTFENAGGRIGVTSADRTCGEATSAGVGAGSHATLTTSSTGPIVAAPGAYTNTATGTASVGTIHLSADNHASTATYFAGAQANGGWNDSVTIDNAALTGTSGIWVFALHVEGTLAALGNYGASSGFGVEVMKNHDGLFGLGAGIPSYDAFVAANGPLAPSSNVYYGAFEQKNWSNGWGDNNHDVTTVINEDVMFAIPFTYGTAFTLGVFGQVSAGESSASIYFGDNQASADFANTISWVGKGYALDASGSGPHSTDFSISSLSNFAYAGGVPEPASWTLMLAGFGAIGAVARRRRGVVAA